MTRPSLFSSVLLLLPLARAAAVPYPTSSTAEILVGRQYVAGISVPYFPEDIPSCVACQPEWSGISSCAEAAPAFQNAMNIIYNPLSFVSAIKCACTDTFSSAYPQCVDCFVQTNQCEQYLGVPTEQNATSILDGIRNVCGFGSALLGGVAASQSSAGLTYTYKGVPSQGYPTTTSIGVGGINYGSADYPGAASSSSLRAGSALLVVATTMLAGAVVVFFG
ncbi:hypothetical protein JCM8547_003873 [Rhodosporidiobolus lusitaniae]